MRGFAIVYDAAMSSAFRFSAARALLVSAFVVPCIVAACALEPLSNPGTTGTGGGTTGTGGGGGTSTSSGTSGTTNVTSSSSTGGSGGTAGATISTSTTGGTGGTATTGGTSGTTSTGGMGTGGIGGSTSMTVSSSATTGGAGGTMTTGSGGTTVSTGGSMGTGGAAMDGGMDDGDAGMGDASSCGTTVATFALEASPHVAACSVVNYSTNPPTSGPHYPSWAAFKVYTQPVPRGFYVHAMEHGAVVIAYNCPTNCDAEVAALVAYLDSRPADPLCTLPLKNRFIVTPDPLLDVPFAAAAWGASLKSQCFDLAALGTFIDQYYAKAPENFCFDGFDPTAPGSGVPADCGQPPDGGTD